jgi:hypothetical protein
MFESCRSAAAIQDSSQLGNSPNARGRIASAGRSGPHGCGGLFLLVPNRFDDPMARFDVKTKALGTLNFVL